MIFNTKRNDKSCVKREKQFFELKQVLVEHCLSKLASYAGKIIDIQVTPQCLCDMLGLIVILYFAIVLNTIQRSTSWQVPRHAICILINIYSSRSFFIHKSYLIIILRCTRINAKSESILYLFRFRNLQPIRPLTILLFSLKQQVKIVGLNENIISKNGKSSKNSSLSKVKHYDSRI